MSVWFPWRARGPCPDVPTMRSQRGSDADAWPVVPTMCSQTGSDNDPINRQSEIKQATTQLADDHRRREFTKGLCVLLFFVSGTFFGLSPLILPISAAFRRGGADASTTESSVFFYGVAVMTAGYTSTSVYACFRVARAPLASKRRFVTRGVAIWPVAFAALAAAVALRARALLFAAFLLMGHSFGVVVGYLHLVEVSERQLNTPRIKRARIIRILSIKRTFVT